MRAWFPVFDSVRDVSTIGSVAVAPPSEERKWATQVWPTPWDEIVAVAERRDRALANALARD